MHGLFPKAVTFVCLSSLKRIKLSQDKAGLIIKWGEYRKCPLSTRKYQKCPLFFKKYQKCPLCTKNVRNMYVKRFSKCSRSLYNLFRSAYIFNVCGQPHTQYRFYGQTRTVTSNRARDFGCPRRFWLGLGLSKSCSHRRAQPKTFINPAPVMK